MYCVYSMQPIHYKFVGNVCKLTIPVSQRVKNVRNCDVYIGIDEFVFVADVEVKRFKSPRRFSFKGLKNTSIAYRSQERNYTCSVMVFPDVTDGAELDKVHEKDLLRIEEEKSNRWNLTNLRRITPTCFLTVDGEICSIERNYCYGFAGMYRGSPKTEGNFSNACRIRIPHLCSPLNRKLRRLKDENRDFCSQYYKLNLFDLRIPENLPNPLQYKIDFSDSKRNSVEQTAYDMICKKEFSIKVEDEQINIDCDLVSILMAICYEIRCTGNKTTDESATVLTTLSSALCYFERFDNLVDVVECFLRRSLIYPVYRNYDLSCLCVEDTITALQTGSQWIIKQLLTTYNCFNHTALDRKLLASMFLEGYILYVSKFAGSEHLIMLSQQVKNVFLDVNKKRLGLGLEKIEAKLLKQLIENSRISNNEFDEHLLNYVEMESPRHVY